MRSILIAGATFLAAVASQPAGAVWIMDFDSVGGGTNNIASGTFLESTYSGLGSFGAPGASATISALGLGNGPTINRPVAFPSNAPTGGDSDLGSPYTGTVVGSPSLGASGAYRNILISQENACGTSSCSTPDDEVDSRITIAFSTGMRILGLDYMDIEGSENGTSPTASRVVLTNSSGPQTFLMSATGNNGIGRLQFNGTAGILGVTDLTVFFKGSGAVDNISGDVSGVPEPATLGLLGVGLLGLPLMRRRRR